MRVGIPTEIKADEHRVAITPSGVAAFAARGHEVVIEAGAGTGSAIPDETYQAAGATVVDGPDAVWQRAELVLKVKEPLDPEFDRMRPGQVLFTYLHLAASRPLTTRLLERRVIGIGYETVQFADGTLPLLVPMSEVAGRLSIQAGATSLEMRSGGKGLLLPGVSPASAGAGSPSSARASSASTPAWWASGSGRTSRSSTSTRCVWPTSATSCRGT